MDCSPPLPPSPPSLFPSEMDGGIDSAGGPLDQQLLLPQQGWGFEGLSGGSGSYGSEKNGQSEEHEEHESGQSQLCARGHWRPAEDSKLRELVAQYGPQNWNLIAENLEGRSGKSCRLRWFNQLDPRINKKAFTEEEEERLLSAHGLYGNKWALIARYFPGRTDNAVKNHWHVIVARKQREQSNAHRRRKSSNTASTSASKAFDERMQVDCGTSNACIAEPINRDEPPSSSTDLSLNSSAYFSFPGHGFFDGYPPQDLPRPFELLSAEGTLLPSSSAPCYTSVGFCFIHHACFPPVSGSYEKLVNVGNGFSQGAPFYSESDFGHSFPVVSAAGANRSGYSDSNSEASATESVANKGGDAIMLEENDNDSEKANVPFIDFLGVGAT